MSIFSNQQKQSPSDTKSTVTPVINPDVLGKFNLTQEDINASYQNLEVENTIKEIAQQAITYYSEIASGQISFADPKPVKLGEIAIKPLAKETSDVVDSLFDQVTKMEAVMDPNDLKHTKVYLSTFAENYGQKALEAKDWKTTIISYDLATEGGIIQAPQVLQNLNELFKDDKETRIKIVELVQLRIDTRGPKTINSTTTSTVINSEPSPLPVTPENASPAPALHTEVFPPLSQTTQAPETLVHPVGTPNSPILGETTLRPAPPNPANHLP